MPNPILSKPGPDAHAPSSPEPAIPASAQMQAGGRELARVLPPWDLVPPGNVITFRRRAR